LLLFPWLSYLRRERAMREKEILRMGKKLKHEKIRIY
jgi:hypothetical protein